MRTRKSRHVRKMRNMQDDKRIQEEKDGRRKNKKWKV